ncbi:hypothetical protein PVAP13_9NG386646 [Panicum virgatum]|uniref:Uncharacterized protein n=1 Tax=Panicum virgatum TaxID=38727 RepID=A0A8T0MKZ8_PANVG|nr:hypothetical protein PVAP13_9NG386646 [Panicum virgatum]
MPWRLGQRQADLSSGVDLRRRTSRLWRRTSEGGPPGEGTCILCGLAGLRHGHQGGRGARRARAVRPARSAAVARSSRTTAAGSKQGHRRSRPLAAAQSSRTPPVPSPGGGAEQQPLQHRIDARVLVVFLCAVLVAAELLAGSVLAPGPSSPPWRKEQGRHREPGLRRRRGGGGTALRARSTAAARRSRVGASLATRERWG